MKWVEMFISLDRPNGRLGYAKARVTPYMHAMVYHVPRFMVIHQGIKKFTGQGMYSTLNVKLIYSQLITDIQLVAVLVGVEKLNDDCRRIHLNRSNKWDAPKDVLLVGKRVERLSKCDRERRIYQKQNSNYWENGIKESRAKRHRISAEVIETNTSNTVIAEELNATEIKQKLKDLGVKTRYRCLKKLKQLLIDTLNDKENQSPNI